MLCAMEMVKAVLGIEATKKTATNFSFSNVIWSRIYDTGAATLDQVVSDIKASSANNSVQLDKSEISVIAANLWFLFVT